MNMFDLTGKVALVTGGAHSIGFAMGVGLAKAGATVCFNCTSESSRERGIANYAAEGIKAYGYVADVTKEEEITALVAKIKEMAAGEAPAEFKAAADAYLATLNNGSENGAATKALVAQLEEGGKAGCADCAAILET